MELILRGVIIVFGIWMVLDIWTFARGQRRKRKAGVGPAADYMQAQSIIDRYMSPATAALRPSERLHVRNELLANFSKTAGAKPSECESNGALLRNWMEANAARFVIENREQMR